MVSERAMREIYLKGFGICVREAQPKAVMTSYNLLNGTHTAESRGLKMKDRQITYTVLTRENLFSEENRNLLFTISR